MSESRQKLYNALSQQFELGSFDEFNSKMDNPSSRKKLYDAVSKTFDLGDFKTFETKIAPPARQEVPASIAKPVPSTVAKPVPTQAQPQQQPNVGERIVQAEVGKAQLEQPQAAPQPKQPTVMQGFRDITKPVQADRIETVPQPKATPQQAPETWQQATDIAVTETSPDITFEQFQQKRQAQQPFSLGGMLKSDKQKAFEQESEMLKRYADVYDFNAQQAATNFQSKFGLSIDNAQTLETELQPFFTKQNQIDAELKGYEAQWQQASAIPDEAARSAAQDRIKAEFNVKVGELNTLEAQYKDKLDAYRFYADSPEYSIYKDLKGKSTEAKNRRAQLPLDERYKDVTQDIGELEGLANAYTRGMQNAEIADILSAGRQPTTEELRRIAQLKREQEGYKVSDAVERFNNASGFKESAKAFLSNPLEITSQWVTESLVAQMSHGITRAGVGAGMGAAIGTVVPVIGTAAGAGTGFIAGMGMAGFNLEYSSSILESLQEAGIDITNEDSLINGFSDANKMKQAKEFALKRGVPISVFDMVTGGIGGKIAKAPIKSAFKKGVAEFGTEMVGAGGGEVAAQLISKGEISGKEVFAEMMGEIGAGAPTVAVNNLVALKQKASGLKGKEKTDVEAQIVEQAVQTDVPVETFNEVVNLHEGAGLIEPQAADELKSQYEQAQANKPVKTMQDELQVGDTVEMSPEVTAPTQVVAEEQPISEPINTEEDAEKQQGGQMRVQGEQRQAERGGDSDMPIVNEAELQDRKAAEEEVKPQAGSVVGGEVLGKPSERKGNALSFPINSKGVDVGSIVVRRPKDEGYTVSVVSMIEAEQGKGLGKKAYRELNALSIKETGKPLKAGLELNDKSTALWESLVNSGEAEKTNNGYAFKQQSLKATPKEVVAEKSQTQELQKPVTDEKAEQAAQKPLLEGVRDGGTKAEAGQESPELRAQKEEVVEERFTVNKTDYIKRGDEYFSKPNKGKEKPITQKVFENAKAKVKNIEEGVAESDTGSIFATTQQEQMTAQQSIPKAEKFNFVVLQETEKAKKVKIPYWEGVDDFKSKNKQLFYETWIPNSILEKGDSYAKNWAISQRDALRVKNQYQKKIKMPKSWETLGEYAPKRIKKTRKIIDEDKKRSIINILQDKYQATLRRIVNDEIAEEQGNAYEQKLANALMFGNIENPLVPTKDEIYYENIKQADEGVNISDLEIRDEKVLSEIPKLPLSHVSGLSMRPDQAVGTYLSTEKAGNRYAKGGKKAKAAKVKIKKPYITNDTGNLELRKRILTNNPTAFTQEDFAMYEVPKGRFGIDDLNDTGIRKLAQLTTDYLKSKGYDSIYFPESKTQEGELIVFDKENVEIEQDANETFSYTKGGFSYILRKYGQGKDAKYTRQLKGEGNKEVPIDASVYAEQKGKADRRSSRSRQAYESRAARSEMQDDFNRIDFYNDPYTFIVNMLARGLKVPVSVFQEVYKGEQELKAYSAIIDKTQDNISLDSFAEGLQFNYQDTPNANQGKADEDFRDAFISALSVGSKPIDFMAEAVHIYKQENGIYDLERQQMEMDAERILEEDITDAMIKEAEEYLNSLSPSQLTELQNFLNEQAEYERADKGLERNVGQAETKSVPSRQDSGEKGVSERPIGSNEKRAIKRLEDAKKALEVKQKALEDKRNSIRKQQAKESQFDIFGKPKQAIEADLDVSERNIQSTIRPFAIEVENAKQEVRKAEKAVLDARKSDEAQGELFAPTVSEPVSKAATEAQPQAEKGVGETVQQGAATTRQPTTEASLADVEATDKGKRFEAGKKLTKEEKREVLKGLKDAYWVNQRPYTIEDTESGERKVYLDEAADYMETSDITGRKLRWFIELPDGRIAHPTEVYGEVSNSEVQRQANGIERADRDNERNYKKATELIKDKNLVADILAKNIDDGNISIRDLRGDYNEIIQQRVVFPNIKTFTLSVLEYINNITDEQTIPNEVNSDQVDWGRFISEYSTNKQQATDVATIFESVAQAYADMKNMKPKDARAKKAEIKETIKANPKADFIFTNWNKLKKQLKFTTKGDCP